MAFNALIERGHSIVIIEHNEQVIKCADHLIDLGPEGGREGGQLVACGTPEFVVQQGRGYTARYLKSTCTNRYCRNGQEHRLATDDAILLNNY